MKKIITIAFLFAASVTSYSQSLRYQDLGVLFSKNDDNGSARFTSMSGAFGALGGDVSALSINPAGIAVFQNSSFFQCPVCRRLQRRAPCLHQRLTKASNQGFGSPSNPSANPRAAR